jgi:hypothetical protein
VGPVYQLLVAGVGMDGGHQASLHPDGVVEDLDHRHEAVDGSGRVRHDLVDVGIEGVIVHARDEGGIRTLARCRHDDERRTGIHLRSGTDTVAERHTYR